MQKKLSALDIHQNLKEIFDDPLFHNLPKTMRCQVNTPLPETEAFSSYKDILFAALDKALLNRYSDVEIKTQKKLIFFTWVIPSGLGDLSMQIHIAEMIHKKMPELDIELISLVEKKSPIPETLKSYLPHHIIHYSHPKSPSFSDEIIDLLRNSFSTIEIPTAYFDFPNLKNLITKNNPHPPPIKSHW